MLILRKVDSPSTHQALIDAHPELKRRSGGKVTLMHTWCATTLSMVIEYADGRSLGFGK